jgi:TPR repeat protein
MIPAATTLEAPSTIASPAGRKAPAQPAFSVAEIATLLARGDSLFATGDVVSARLLYERAADAGEAGAAVRLGETFDPSFLEDPRLRGVRGDPGTAAFWYRRARDLGATGVASRLNRLEAKEGRN